MTRQQKEQWAYLQDEARLIAFIATTGLTAIGGERQRYDWVQLKKYNDGKSKAKPGQSQHEVCKASDFTFFGEDGYWLKVPHDPDEIEAHRAKLQPIGDFWESLHPKNRWGGNFNSLYDPGHFERKD